MIAGALPDPMFKQHVPLQECVTAAQGIIPMKKGIYEQSYVDLSYAAKNSSPRYLSS